MAGQPGSVTGSLSVTPQRDTFFLWKPPLTDVDVSNDAEKLGITVFAYAESDFAGLSVRRCVFIRLFVSTVFL